MLDGINTFNLTEYIKNIKTNPFNLITFIVDIVLVMFLVYEIIKLAKQTRVGQLLKGIALLIVITFLSGIFKLRILNFILTSFMTYGVILLLIIFQPELRRALEQLGSSTFSRFFGVDKTLMDKTKEDIYKTVIATEELSKRKIGALIVFERDIRLKDIIDSGVVMDADVSPQLLVNIFIPNTPLHDGAVIISDNKIASAACILPLADDKYIAKELGTRHRAGIGISKESDAIAIIVSEETGKVSIAKDGTLIADVNSEALKSVLIKHLLTAKFDSETRNAKVSKLKSMIDDKATKIQVRRKNRKAKKEALKEQEKQNENSAEQ